jgi:hypothetical protein
MCKLFRVRKYPSKSLILKPVNCSLHLQFKEEIQSVSDPEDIMPFHFTNQSQDLK